MAQTSDPPSLVKTDLDNLDKDMAHGSLMEASMAEQGGVDASAEHRKIIRRIDRRLIITTGFMYCVSLVDRTNIGSANIAGMAKDLGLDLGYRYVSLTWRQCYYSSILSLELTRGPLVNHRTRLFHLLYSLRTCSYYYLSKNWRQVVFACCDSALGNSASL